MTVVLSTNFLKWDLVKQLSNLERGFSCTVKSDYTVFHANIKITVNKIKSLMKIFHGNKWFLLNNNNGTKRIIDKY